MLDELPDWVSSDHHFGHKNISAYSARTTPAFPTPESIDQLMIDNWHGLVKPNDTILHLGDLSFWKPTDEQGREKLLALPGKKLFVRGNHDIHWSTEDLAEVGFTEVDSPSIMFEGVAVIFSHYPQYNLQKGQVNVFGHQHNNPCANTMSHLNICVELWHYAPVPGRFAVGKVVWGSRTNSKDRGPRTVKWRGRKRK